MCRIVISIYKNSSNWHLFTSLRGTKLMENSYKTQSFCCHFGTQPKHIKSKVYTWTICSDGWKSWRFDITQNLKNLAPLRHFQRFGGTYVYFVFWTLHQVPYLWCAKVSDKIKKHSLYQTLIFRSETFIIQVVVRELERNCIGNVRQTTSASAINVAS